MPVRIYDISKKLGLENKEILAKAKAMGIAAAKVPSSSLDKISAECLEEELFKDHPEIAARFKAPPAPAVEAPKPRRSRKKSSSSPHRRPSRPKPEPKPEPPPVIEAPKPPPPPPKPAGPKVGDKVGFIQLPQKPSPKISEKAGPAKCTVKISGAGQNSAADPARQRRRKRTAKHRLPRRRRNLSPRRAPRSSSSSRRLSSANWPRSSSKSRSRSSPI